MLTEEQKKELEHIDIRDLTDYQVWYGVHDFDLRIAFCNEKGIPPHSAIMGTELEDEFNMFCMNVYRHYGLDIELDFDEEDDG